MDDKRNESLNRKRGSYGTKVAIFVFTFIITTTIFYFFWDDDSIVEKEGSLNGEDLKHINQDIDTGFPDF